MSNPSTEIRPSILLPRQPVPALRAERRERAGHIVGRNARSLVPDLHHTPGFQHDGGGITITDRIVDQVGERPPQRHRLALDSHR